VLTRLRHSRPVGLARYYLYRDILLARPRRHSCNICGWRGRRFLTYYHDNVLCPQCGSQVRHRLIAAALDLPVISALARLEGATMLHVSPEYCMGLVFRPRVRRVVRADFMATACDVLMDATHIPLGPGSVDVVMACDTLEHIPDDRAALSEFRRVLRPGGIAILTVPQSDATYPTYEDPSVNTDDQRARAYGQPDHVRNYGADFGERLEALGFGVTCVAASDFADAFVTLHVLRPPVPLGDSWGWNDRRIYFAVRT
jgi:SAM-dependent methyltransferase